MAHDTSLQENYNSNAAGYTQFLSTPLGTLEAQLFALCITNCSGQRVLDLGGGTGLRARDALAAGAASVDVVDISTSMMDEGQRYEQSINRDTINWYHGDVSKTLEALDLGMYDMVIANGIFDHAEAVQDLETMFENCAKYLKPGGRFVFNRNNPLSKAANEGEYGVVFGDFRDIEGGVQFKYRIRGEPELVFEPTMLEAYYKGSMEIPKRYFENLEVVRWEECEVVMQDTAFWRKYLEDPILFIYVATKKQY